MRPERRGSGWVTRAVFQVWILLEVQGELLEGFNDEAEKGQKIETIQGTVMRFNGLHAYGKHR